MGNSVSGKDHHPSHESPIFELYWFWNCMLLIFWFYNYLEVARTNINSLGDVCTHFNNTITTHFNSKRAVRSDTAVTHRHWSCRDLGLNPGSSTSLCVAVGRLPSLNFVFHLQTGDNNCAHIIGLLGGLNTYSIQWCQGKGDRFSKR